MKQIERINDMGQKGYRMVAKQIQKNMICTQQLQQLSDTSLHSFLTLVLNSLTGGAPNVPMACYHKRCERNLKEETIPDTFIVRKRNLKIESMKQIYIYSLNHAEKISHVASGLMNTSNEK